MNPTAMLAQSHQVAHDVLANVTRDQLALDTPCKDWKVADLIDHLVGGQHWARSAMEGSEMIDGGAGAAQGDYLATFDAAAQAALDAFSAEGALAKTVNPGFGDMPAMALLGLSATDTFTHAWDLAKATGQDTDLEPDLAAGLLAQSRQSIQPAFRSDEGTIFGPEQPAPEGASAADQLAAFLGRSV
jgi:uncharacterized protein (TIGR03086 family)